MGYFILKQADKNWYKRIRIFSRIFTILRYQNNNTYINEPKSSEIRTCVLGKINRKLNGKIPTELVGEIDNILLKKFDSFEISLPLNNSLEGIANEPIPDNEDTIRFWQYALAEFAGRKKVILLQEQSWYLRLLAGDDDFIHFHLELKNIWCYVESGNQLLISQLIIIHTRKAIISVLHKFVTWEQAVVLHHDLLLPTQLIISLFLPLMVLEATKITLPIIL